MFALDENFRKYSENYEYLLCAIFNGQNALALS